MKLINLIGITSAALVLSLSSNMALANVSHSKNTTNTTKEVAKNSHDGEIIAFMEALNNHEIDAAKVALKKEIDEDTTNFAKMMEDQHSANLKAVEDVSSSTKIDADETDVVKQFKENGEKSLASLSELNGKEFQKAYVDAMVKGHKEAAAKISKFISQAKNPELEKYLVDTKKAVLMHLSHAQKLQKAQK